MTNYEALKQLNSKQFAGVVFQFVKNEVNTAEELLARLDAECPKCVEDELQ